MWVKGAGEAGEEKAKVNNFLEAAGQILLPVFVCVSVCERAEEIAFRIVGFL